MHSSQTPTLNPLADMLSVTTLFLIFLFSSCVFFASNVLATKDEHSNFELSLSFLPQESRLIGTSKITIEAGKSLTLSLTGLEITGTLLQDQNGKEHQLRTMQEAIHLPIAQASRTLYLSYTKTIQNDFENLISPDGISLTSNWYPLPDRPMLFHLTATLPDNFSAVTESDSFPLKQEGNTVNAYFSRLTTTLHFIAGPYLIEKFPVRDGLFVYSMFFAEDSELAAGYLQAAAAYLNRYEKEIGTYPFNHYVIVANRKPTGFGMPSFTLLGQRVLRLPFIKDTSLGHEIVHSWFGNAVDVDYSQGNWCEGLTSFLADHAYREEKGEGTADRLETITRYHSYVHLESAVPLSAFTSASHTQPMAEARRSIGYDRGALFFFELREKIGRQPFQQGLRSFYRDNKGQMASWDQLQQSFETESGLDLNSFFTERIKRSEIPHLGVKDIEVEYQKGSPVLNLTLLQQSDKPFSLIVPIEIKTVGDTLTKRFEITAAETRITIPLDQRPLEFSIDPEITFLRQLTDAELPAVWSRFLGSEKPLVILGRDSEALGYQSMVDTLRKTKVHVVSSEEVSNKQLAENDLLFLGSNQAPARSIFGPANLLEKGFSLDVRHNPLNRKRVAVLVSSSAEEETVAVARRLNHYGKYSYLEFQNGRNTTKKIEPTSTGLRFVLEQLPVGGALTTIHSFEETLEQLSKNRVVYVGETHTSFADHLLQLRIIEALYKKNPNLAIGMEMFPSSSQAALDRYTLSEDASDVQTFLKESAYYDVWRFDFRFFLDILNFARHNHLPVIGLNLDKEIVSEVFRSGGTDGLKKEILDSLPEDRDLDLEGYTERLTFMHNIHLQGSHGTGEASGFIQAQGLWDETMAENIVTFLRSNPNSQLVVLAGSQHTRKDSGIPPRVARRLAVSQASVLNIYNDNAPVNPGEVADYFFLAADAELPESPKIGIILNEVTRDGKTWQKISQFSPHGKAAEAGLLEGDILQEVNGYPVSTMADLRIAMVLAKAGDTIDIKVIRGTGNEDQELSFKVELTIPPPSVPPL